MWPARLFVPTGGKSRLQAGLMVLGLSACVVLSGCPDATVNNPPPQTVVYQPQPVYQTNPAYQRQPVYQANPAYQSHATYQPNPAYQPQPGYQPQPNPPQGAAPAGTPGGGAGTSCRRPAIGTPRGADRVVSATRCWRWFFRLQLIRMRCRTRRSGLSQIPRRPTR